MSDLIDPDYQPPLFWLTGTDLEAEGLDAFNINPRYPYNIVHEKDRSYVDVPHNRQ